MRDYFVASVFDDTNPNKVELVRMDRYQKRGYPFYKARIRSNHDLYRINRGKTLVDATSLGESVVQDVADIGAEGYKFTGSQAKFEVVQDLARMLAEHRLVLPNRREIVDELRYFEYTITPGKQLKMEAAQGHDDIVMSLALAARLAAIPRKLGLMKSALLPSPTLNVTPLRRRQPSPLGRDPWAELFADEV